MANDRVMIRCSGCNAWKMLLKHKSGYGPITDDNGILEWIDSHASCHSRRYRFDLNGDPGFTLHTEDDEILAFEKQNAGPPDESLPKTSRRLLVNMSVTLPEGIDGDDIARHVRSLIVPDSNATVISVIVERNCCQY